MDSKDTPRIPSDAEVCRMIAFYRSLASSRTAHLTPEEDFLFRHEIAPHRGHDGTTVMVYREDRPEKVVVPAYMHEAL